MDSLQREESHSVKLPSVSVCFPAYNEEATVGEVLQEAHDLLSASGLDYEIIVCNDGSVDRTGAIIESMACRLQRMRAINNPRNLGIRATFERLYSEAAKEFVFLNSTDQQWPTRILFDMLALTSDWDIIIASRKQKHYSPARRFVSWGFNTAPSILFGVRTYDAGAVKLVRREIIERFTLVSRSPFSEAERLIRSARAGYRITEYPVTIAARRAGRAQGVSFGSVVEALKDVIRVRLDLRSKASGERGDRSKEMQIL
jgi:glycosyltransferase involved in cell wall biosynthesis